MPDKSHRHVKCENCSQFDGSLFGTFCGAEIELMSSSKTCTYYKKNQPLFLEGSTPRGVFCLHSGKVKIFTRGEEGKEQIIHLAAAGDYARGGRAQRHCDGAG